METDPLPKANRISPVSRSASQRHRTETRWVLLEHVLYLGAFILIGVAAMNFVISEVRPRSGLGAMPDMQRWSQAAKQRYLAAIEHTEAPVLGSLRVPSLNLAVPVYASDSELSLDRGAATIDGMAYPHEAGHIGIAGHRDGYFRALEDIRLGAALELDTLKGTKHFVVDDIQIVGADDVSYLAETDEQRLTLVTCYPFYRVGSAPNRFLVRASRRPPDPAALHTSQGETP